MKYHTSWDLTTIPQDVLESFLTGGPVPPISMETIKTLKAKRSAANRKTKTGGRNGGRPRTKPEPEFILKRPVGRPRKQFRMQPLFLGT